MLPAVTGVPILLTGAALVGLPILLHLIMRQEPKRMTFPAFRFLKQRRQINQRKIRLRHLLLLAMRMALIALICLSLFQPTILSEGFSLRGDRPVAAVIVIDTSPSMGYVLSDRSGLTEARKRGLKLLEESADGPWTCLDECRGRALEFLEDFPAGSKVAVIDTADRAEPAWSAGTAEARRRIRDIKRPRANSRPVTRAIEGAYSLLSKVDQEREPGQDPLPRVVAVFSDRTVASWEAGKEEDLKALRDRIPPPSVFQFYVDVGVENPLNTGIIGFEMAPQIVAAHQPIKMNVSVESTGGGSENILLFSIDGEEPQRIPITTSSGSAVTRQLRHDPMKPGLHQARISLLKPDALPFDNERFVTFRVREPRRVLILVDGRGDGAVLSGFAARSAAENRSRLFAFALDSKGWYAPEPRPLEEAVEGRIEWSAYEAVVLLGLPVVPEAVWDKALEYVQAGGKLVVAPDGPTMNPAGYRGDAAAKLLPRAYDRWIATPADQPPMQWAWNAFNSAKSMAVEFRRAKDATDLFDALPPITRGYWRVEDGPADRVIVPYQDSPEPEKRSPALLDRSIGRNGKVFQFTVPMGLHMEKVHDYATTWFYPWLVNETMRSLLGDSDELVFNYSAGQNIFVKPPATDGKTTGTIYLSGPDVAPNDAVIKLTEQNQGLLRFGPERAFTAGHFTLQLEGGTWRDGFSINPAFEESMLDRIKTQEIDAVLGKDSVAPADKELKLTDALGDKYTQPIELFPFLMILLLLFMASENLLANRFYRRRDRSG